LANHLRQNEVVRHWSLATSAVNDVRIGADSRERQRVARMGGMA
jgi:hypothetical protein